MDFDEYWGDVRKGLKPETTPNSIDVVSLAVLHAWAQDTDNVNRPPFVVVSGTNRDMLYRQVQSEEWMFDKPGNILDLHGPTTSSWVYGLTRHLTERIRYLRIPPELHDSVTFTVPLPEAMDWEVLWALTASTYLAVDDPLDQLIDQRFSLLSDAHRGLLEARFEVVESHDLATVQGVVEALGAWVEGQKHSTMHARIQEFLARAHISQTVTEPERTEVLHFLLTLAKQNGLLGGVVLAIDGLENLLSKDVGDDLLRFLDVSAQWVRYGSPFSLIIGWRGTKDDAKELRKVHPKLARRIIEADRWLRELSDSEVR